MKPPEKKDSPNPGNPPTGHETALSPVNLVIFALFTLSILAAGISISNLVGKTRETERPVFLPVVPPTPRPETQTREPEQQPEQPAAELLPVFTFPELPLPETKKPVEPPANTASEPKEVPPPPPPPSASLLSTLLLKHQAEDKDVDGVLADIAGTAIVYYSVFRQINGRPGLAYEQVKALLVNPEFITELISDVQIINKPFSTPGNTPVSVCPDCALHIKKTLQSSKLIHRDINSYFSSDAVDTANTLINIIAAAGLKKKPNSEELKLVQHALTLLSDTQSDRFARMLLTIPDQSRTGTVSFLITESLRRGIQRGGWNSMFEAVPVNLDSLRLPLINTGDQRRTCIASWLKALERARRQPIPRAKPHTPSRHRIKQQQLVFVRRAKLLACLNFWLQKVANASEDLRAGKPVEEEKFLPAKCVIDPLALEQQLREAALSSLQLPQIILEQQRFNREITGRIDTIKTRCAGDWFTAQTVIQKVAILFSASSSLMKFALKKRDALFPAVENHANALVRLRYELLRSLHMIEVFHKENPEATLHIFSGSKPFLPQLSTGEREATAPIPSLHQLPKLHQEAERLRKLVNNSPSDQKVIDRLQIVIRYLSVHERGAFQSLADGLQLYIRDEPYLAASLLKQAALSRDAALLFQAIMKKDISDIIQLCQQQYQPKADCKKCHSERLVTCDPCRGLGYNWCKKCSGSGKPTEKSSATILPLPHCAVCDGIGGHLCNSCAGTGQTICSQCAPERKNSKGEISYQDFEKLQDVISIARWRASGVVDLYTSHGIRGR